MSKILFSEEQKQKTPWIWMVIFPIICLYMYIMFSKKADSNFIGSEDFDGYIILCSVFFVMMVGLTTLFYKMKLTTIIKPDGIHIKFPPMQKKERFISRKEITRYEIIEFNRISRMRGHRIKGRLRKTGKVYTISGKYGLIIHLTNQKKILIDTNRKEAVKSAMHKLMKED
jgi:hypothetical protein